MGVKRYTLPNEQMKLYTLIESDRGRLVLHEDYAQLERTMIHWRTRAQHLSKNLRNVRRAAAEYRKGKDFQQFLRDRGIGIED